MTRFGHFLVDEALQSRKYCTPSLNRLAAFIAIAMPLSIVVERLIAPEAPSTASIRIVATLLCFGVVAFPSFWNKRPEAAAIYWMFAVSFTGIFLFSCLLFLNAALTQNISHAPTLWILQYFVALFITMQVLSSPALFAVCWVTATAASASPLFVLENPNWAAVKMYVVYPAPVILSALVFGAATARNSSIIAREKLQTAASIGLNIAHELRTPLASIRAFSDGTNKHVPRLIEGYRKAVDAGLVGDPLNGKQLRNVAEGMRNIKNEVEYSNTIINMLLISTSERPGTTAISETCMASACIREAAQRFPFNNDVERNALRIDIEQDFEIKGAELVVVHVLFNLIKNGVRFAMHSEMPEVLVRATASGSDKMISVRDSGPGIEKHQQRVIFERFYTTQGIGQGTGVGLSFCKTAMESLGGSIECLSDGATYTEFRLRFP
ncbi:MAG: HAMP domain-containing sensor histidine kinase [Pseudomonadota bacterium]